MDAALGGSITKGSNASDEAHKYRNLVHAWLQSTYVNGFPRVAWSAIGGSHSFQNLFRLDALIAQHPRLIIIDSAVNDDNSTASRGCAEIVIRRLRTYLPNTKLLGLLNIRVADPDIDDPTNVNQTQHDDWVDLLTYYSIPYADFAAEVQAKVPGTHPLNWYLADTVHPTDNGHATIATLIEAQLSSFLPPTGALPDYLRYYSVDFNYPPQIVYVKDCFRYGTWTLDANGAYCSSQAGATITIPTPITCRAISASDGVEGDLSGLPSVLVSQDGGITFVTMTLDENGHYCFLWPRQPRNIVLKVVSGTYKIKYFMFI
jgi:lysophospholipase L1-like esterase